MAIIMGQKKNMNDAINLALQIAMNQNAQRQKQAGDMALEGYRTQNAAALQNQKSAQELQKMLLEGQIKDEQSAQDWLYKVSLLKTRREQLIAIAPLVEQGKLNFGDLDIDSITNELQQMDESTAKGMSETILGRVSPESLQSVITNAPDALPSVINQGGQSARQTQTFPLEERKVAATEQGVFNESQRLAFDRDKVGTERRKQQIDILDKIDSVLNAQGVQTEEGKLTMKELKAAFESTFGGGAMKEIDPMSPKITGNVRQIINTLKWKLTNEDLTPEEAAMVPTLANFYKIRQTGSAPVMPQPGGDPSAGGRAQVAGGQEYVPNKTVVTTQEDGKTVYWLFTGKDANGKNVFAELVNYTPGK